MKDQTNYGGQAFPRLASDGMTMRQYYKASAMQGLLAMPGLPASGEGLKNLVKRAAEYAGAMVAEDYAKSRGN